MSQQTFKTKPNKTKLSELVLADLEELRLGESAKVSDLVSNHWLICDFFTTRSFDVYYCKAKGILKEKGVLFTRVKGKITKVKDENGSDLRNP